MKPFASIGRLRINGQLVEECDCYVTPEKEVVCWKCVQANLLISDKKREKESGNPETLEKAVERHGVRGTARALGVHHKAVQKWIQKGKIPNEYEPEIARLATP